MTSNDHIIQELRTSRDSLLHPLKAEDQVDSPERSSFSTRFFSDDCILLGLQGVALIDDYLQWFRESLGEVFAQEISDLPMEMVLALARNEKQLLADSISKCQDPEGKRQLKARLLETEGIEEMAASACDPQTPLTPRQNRILERLEGQKRELATPLPSQYPRPSSPAPRQTPLHPELFSKAEDTLRDEPVSWPEREPPQLVVRRRSECISLIVGSLVLLNETYILVTEQIRPIVKELFPDRISVDDDMARVIQEIWPTDTSLDINQRQTELSPYLVAIALLPELLRLYRQVVDSRPDLARGEIDGVLSEDAFMALSRFRNVVFHVARNPSDFDQALRGCLEQLDARILWDIYRGTFNFLISEFVDADRRR